MCSFLVCDEAELWRRSASTWEKLNSWSETAAGGLVVTENLGVVVTLFNHLDPRFVSTAIFKNSAWSSTAGGPNAIWSAGANIFGVGAIRWLHNVCAPPIDTIGLYNGNDWITEQNGGSNLYDVWAASDCAVFALGSLGRILRYQQ
jgi:hypothetical protein